MTPDELRDGTQRLDLERDLAKTRADRDSWQRIAAGREARG